MKIAVIGTGYVGLVSGVCLAAKGHDVTCLDLQRSIVESLNQGVPHIHEEGLPQLLAEVRAKDAFRARLVAPQELLDSDIILVAVGTPSANGQIDLVYIKNAAREIARYLKHATRFCSVVVKSTVVPGTTDTFVRGILEAVSGRKLGDFGLGMNPEFLREGQAITDFMVPDRVVLGHDDPQTRKALEQLYAPWACDKLAVNTRTAEMIKYANNCLLATQISAVNELANIAARMGGIDIRDVIEGVTLDRRWNPAGADGKRVNPGILSYLKPGCGFGGSCFPKDVQALRAAAAGGGLKPDVLDAILAVNAKQPGEVATLIERTSGSLKDRRVLILGLAFKPGTDDVRESASIRIARDLLDRGAIVQAHDPIASANAAKELGHARLSLTSSWEEALPHNEIVILATLWPEYNRLLNPDNRAQLASKIFFDARGRFAPGEFLPTTQYLTIGLRPLA